MILIAGPCVIESEYILESTINPILEAIDGKNIDFFFKSSWRKDNRTLINSFSGLEPKKAIEMLLKMKNKYSVKLCTDFHNSEDLEMLQNIDIIQIPAYLAKQQSLLKKASEFCNENNKIFHIKKPQFVGPVDVSKIVINAKSYGAKNIILTDRGTMLGYNQVFMDPRHVQIMKGLTQVPVLCDVTHPNKNYPGDNTINIISLGKAYVACGADGIFLETHPDCKNALCDANTMLPTSELNNLIGEIYVHSF